MAQQTMIRAWMTFPCLELRQRCDPRAVWILSGRASGMDAVR